MIRSDATLTIAHVPLEQLSIGEHLPRRGDDVLLYAGHLTAHPDADLEPMIVERTTGGHRIINGHHRYVAHIIAGRSTALCVVIDETNHD